MLIQVLGQLLHVWQGGLAEIGHIDSVNCYLTGNKITPMIYYSDTTGQTIFFKPGEYTHFSSMPCARERFLGLGFCAVSRAERAARLLMGLHDYDSEKLSNLPPEGVASVTGLTIDEFNDAMALWKAARTQDNSLTFPQVLWLIGSQPNTEVKVTMTGFSQLPESFNRDSVVNHYVSTLALTFGVDAREFWPISSGALGTASESRIQHMKAKGKGPGEFLSLVERRLNAELPDDASFKFSSQDSEESMADATTAKAWVDALWPLYVGIPNPNLKPPAQPGGSGMPSIPGNEAGQQSNQPAGQRVPKVPAPAKPGVVSGGEMKEDTGNDKPTEQILPKEKFMRLLADKGVLPDYLINDERITVFDAQIHIDKEGHPDDYTKYVFEAGVLKEYRLSMSVSSVKDNHDVPMAELRRLAVAKSSENAMLEQLRLKAEKIIGATRDIKGEPIPDKESGRGARITYSALHAELERWRNNPTLAPYAPTEEEEQSLLLQLGLPK